MDDISEDLKTLYKDAIYFSLIRKGYTLMKAKLTVERLFYLEK